MNACGDFPGCFSFTSEVDSDGGVSLLDQVQCWTAVTLSLLHLREKCAAARLLATETRQGLGVSEIS